MDSIVAAWVMEFLLRRPISDDLASRVLLALPIPDPLPARLRRTVFLRCLDTDLSSNSISPRTLDSLELLLEAGLNASAPCYESVAAAYRAVALHCLVFSAAASGDGSSFNALVDELRSVVVKLDVTPHAAKSMRELVMELRAASESDDARASLFNRDTRTAALDAIRACLKASFEELGPPVVEIAAKTIDTKYITFDESGIKIGQPRSEGSDKDSSGVAVTRAEEGNVEAPSTSLQKDMENDTVPTDKFDHVSTPEFLKVANALKSSCNELQTKVSDPLPDAIKLADQVPKRSLMDKNPTAHTYEWGDDPPESSSPSKNISLPSPKSRKASPLSLVQNKKVGRRKVKRWSVAEEDALKRGVAKHGRGNWKLIRKAYADIFQDRTEVDLKDKWRNMSRY
ncbi:hypothetical protein Cni_G18182 [Canna indica]|uniref:Telomeric repeat-binding factor n=1 Tax=Canna indica TaxID=4628 RepID=A0AAQ3KIQ6_9LILI|nr:hypothetical protein Cni_G18182 [Canna indica]